MALLLNFRFMRAATNNEATTTDSPPTDEYQGRLKYTLLALYLHPRLCCCCLNTKQYSARMKVSWIIYNALSHGNNQITLNCDNTKNMVLKTQFKNHK